MTRKILLFAALATLLQRRADASEEHWVGTWATSPQLTEPQNLPPAPGLADSTLRQILRVSVGGKRLRMRFSNAFGTRPLSIHAVRLARSAGGDAIRPGSDKALTFAGATSIVIPPGERIVSDPISFDVPALSDLAVTLHVTDPTVQVTGHPGSRTTSYLQTGSDIAAVRMPSATKVTHWYYINGIDVLADASVSSVVIVGDSLTDGRGSTTDRNDRWTDELAKRFQSNRQAAKIGIINAGIGGNQVCHGGLGPPVLDRFDRDAIQPPGIRWVILFEGINDLGTRSATAQELIQAYQKIIARSHAHDIRIFGATLTSGGGSFYFTPEFEAERQKVNTWIRDSGAFDGVIDFDAAVRDPQNSSNLLASADSGDHLHLNPNGYRMLARAVSLDLFTTKTPRLIKK